MKIISTRKVDELGRIVLPVDLRREWQLEAGNTVDIVRQDDGTVTIMISRPVCAVCRSEQDLVQVKDACICADCRRELAEKSK